MSYYYKKYLKYKHKYLNLEGGLSKEEHEYWDIIHNLGDRK